MIQLLSTKYCRHIACILTVIFLSAGIPALARGAVGFSAVNRPVYHYNRYNSVMRTPVPAPVASAKAAPPVNKIKAVAKPAKQFIGGPSQPEMTSFKSVGTDNMVNL